jgi:hypothetical protein
MTDFREPTASSVTPTGAAVSPSSGDALHNLYRMSRTAGLGSGDYVAINNTSILALLLGLASLLAILFPLMAVIPVLAVVVGVMALVQIRSSNGTQSGRVFATLGILLGIVLGGATIGKMVMAGVQERRDEAAIDGVIKRLSDFIVAKQYSQAYQTLFSEDFKKNISEKDFETRWESFVPAVGNVVSIGWGGRAEFVHIKETGITRAIATGTMKFEKFDNAQQPFVFVNRDGEWVIDEVKQLFDQIDTSAPKQPLVLPDPTTPLGPDVFSPTIPVPNPQPN